jgi:uncharacterized protein YcfJ
MRTTSYAVATLMATVLLSGCESMPAGPSVAVMPTPGKPFDLFQQEDQQCRGYAAQSLGPNATTAGNQAMLGSAAVGTVIGSAVGALAGGGRGVGGGAAIGLAAGSMVGAGQAQNTAYSLQQRYDIVYQQCMYAKGNQLPPAPQRVRVYRGYYGRGYYSPRYYYLP